MKIHQLKLKPTEPVFSEERGGTYLISNNRQLFFSAEMWDDLVKAVREFEAGGRSVVWTNYQEPDRPRFVLPSTPEKLKKASLDDLV